jgi:maleamate amidohydrolase
MAHASSFEDHCWKDVYSADLLKLSKGYARDTYIGERPALLLIDLYKFVYEGGNRPILEVEQEFSGACGEYAWNAIEPTKKLIAAARHARIPIIYSTRHVDTGTIVSTARKVSRRTNCAPDAYDIWPDFAPHPGDLLIYKERASVFFGTTLVTQLQARDVKSLIICGESTSGCVRATVYDSYGYGYHTTVVEECTYDRNILSHKVNLFDMHHKYADVMHLDEVIAHLRTSYAAAAE